MPINWQLVIKVLLAILRALAELPAGYDHRALAAAAGDVLDLCTGGRPPEPE